MKRNTPSPTRKQPASAGDGSTVFFIANPRKSPWPAFEQLSVDMRGALGEGTWVAAYDGRKERWHLGKVEGLQQSFTIKDVTTGARIDLNSSRGPYFGRVVGRQRSIPSSLDGRKRPRRRKAD